MMENLFVSVEVLIISAIAFSSAVAYALYKRKGAYLKAPEKTEEEPKAEEPKKLDSALKKSRESLFGRLQSLFAKEEIKDWDEIEEVLYTSDLGPKTVQDLMEYLEENTSREVKAKPEDLKQHLKQKLQNILDQASGANNEHTLLKGLDIEAQAVPTVWMIVGVNGSGKTTTLGKLASLLSQKGKKVMVAAGDTFRAAADKQLRVWAERAEVEIYSPENVKDPSAVAYQALEKAKSQGFDHILVDTAGRLHTQKNLMEELQKMKRVMQKVIPDAPHETIIILDANNGQNALQQAKEFHQALGLSGVIFTKMDGTSKAGVAFGVANELDLPIKRIGIGEKLEDLRNFNSKDFVASIFS